MVLLIFRLKNDTRTVSLSLDEMRTTSMAFEFPVVLDVWILFSSYQ